MNIKQILVVGLLVMALSGVGNATTDIQTATIYFTGESGNSQYTNTADSMLNDQGISGNYSLHASYYFKAYSRYYGYSMLFKSTMLPAGGTQNCDGNINCGDGTYAICHADRREQSPPEPPGITINGNGFMTGSCTGSSYACLSLHIRGSPETPPSSGYIKAYVIFTDGYIYTISGTTGCLDNVSLYYNNSGTWDYMSEDHLTDDNHYSFNITPDIDFKLIFDDGHSYEFNVTGDKVYNYDGCAKTTYNFWETSILNQIPDILEPIPDILAAMAEVAIYAAVIVLAVGIVYKLRDVIGGMLKMKLHFKKR